MAIERCEIINFGIVDRYANSSSVIVNTNILTKDQDFGIVKEKNPCIINYKIPDSQKHNSINEIYFLQSEYPDMRAFANNFRFTEFKNKYIELGPEKCSSVIWYTSDKKIVNKSADSSYYFVLISSYSEYRLDKSFKLYGDFGSVATPIINFEFSKKFIQFDIENSFLINSKYLYYIYEQFTIISGVFKYREKGSTGNFLEIPFVKNKVIIPANTFENIKEYECYATCTVDDNQTADSPMIELTTIDTIPVLTCIKPKNEITYGEVFFDWNYDNQTGVEQYAFDLQYSTDNLNWLDLDTHTVSNIAQVNHSVPAGDLFWRVRGYNQNDVASEWSTSAKFINVAKPTKPVISEIVQSGMPAIKWSAENQIAFEIEVDGLWKSGQIYTTNKFYKFEDFIPNGNYQMRLRIYNQYSQVSDWLEFDYYQNMNVNQPQATITETQKGFNIKIKNDLSIMTYYLLKNGIPIHKFIDLEYEDIYVNGDVLYTIRAVDFQGNFADLTLPAKRDKKEVVLIDLQGNIYDLGTNIGDWTKIEKSTIKDRQDVSYLGRSKPVIINGDLEYSQWSIGAVFKDLPLGEILFYRDFSGTGSWVMAHNIGSTINKYYIQSSTVLREVSYEERIEY